MRKNSATESVESTNDLPSPADLPPVNLDPPSTELLHWQKLADRYTVIEHGGDASEVMRMPRPHWSDPERDYVGMSAIGCVYRSALAKVPVASYRGLVDDEAETLEPAYISASVQLVGDQRLMVALSMSYEVDGKWSDRVMRLFLDEATEVANVLLAAVALAESDGQ